MSFGRGGWSGWKEAKLSKVSVSVERTCWKSSFAQSSTRSIATGYRRCCGSGSSIGVVGSNLTRNEKQYEAV